MFTTILLAATYLAPTALATPLDTRTAQVSEQAIQVGALDTRNAQVSEQTIQVGRCTRVSDPFIGACELGSGAVVLCDYGSVC